MIETKIILFHAEWCGHCKRFLPIWNKFKKYIKDNENKIVNSKGETINVKVEEYEEQKDHNTMEALGIRAFPTIQITVNDGEPKDYKGDRTFDALLDAVRGNIQTGGNMNRYMAEKLSHDVRFVTVVNKMAKSLLYNFDKLACNLTAKYTVTGAKSCIQVIKCPYLLKDNAIGLDLSNALSTLDWDISVCGIDQVNFDKLIDKIVLVLNIKLGHDLERLNTVLKEYNYVITNKPLKLAKKLDEGVTKICLLTDSDMTPVNLFDFYLDTNTTKVHFEDYDGIKYGDLIETLDKYTNILTDKTKLSDSYSLDKMIKRCALLLTATLNGMLMEPYYYAIKTTDNIKNYCDNVETKFNNLINIISQNPESKKIFDDTCTKVNQLYTNFTKKKYSKISEALEDKVTLLSAKLQAIVSSKHEGKNIIDIGLERIKVQMPDMAEKDVEDTESVITLSGGSLSDQDNVNFKKYAKYKNKYMKLKSK